LLDDGERALPDRAGRTEDGESFQGVFLSFQDSMWNRFKLRNPDKAFRTAGE
jgi:hypothetical protein